MGLAARHSASVYDLICIEDAGALAAKGDGVLGTVCVVFLVKLV